MDGGPFTLTINGTGFDAAGAIEQIFNPDSSLFGSGTIVSRTDTQIVAVESMDGAAPGDYTVRVLNPDTQVSNVRKLTLHNHVAATPFSANAGTSFVLEGRGFSGSSGVALTLTRPDASQSNFAAAADGAGYFAATIDSTGFDPGFYSVTATDSATGIQTRDSNFVVVDPGCLPAITTQPVGQSIRPGRTTTLSVITNSALPQTFQWFEGVTGDTASPVAGATSNTFVTAALSVTAKFWVRATNSCGDRDSNTATVAVGSTECSPAAIVAQPASTNILPGDSVSLNVTATGDAPLAFQWFEGPAGNTLHPIPGATASTFNSPPLNTSTNFWVRVWPSCGPPVDSDAAAALISGSLGLLLEDPYNDQNSGTMPLILIHGIGGNVHDGGDTLFNPYEDNLKSLRNYYKSNDDLHSKYRLYRFHFRSLANSVQDIGGALAGEIDAKLPPNQPVVLVAHSMGSIVARSYMEEWGGGPRVQRLITLGGTHHGTPAANRLPRAPQFADWQSAMNSGDHLFWFFIGCPACEFDPSHVNRSDLRWDNFNGMWDSVPEYTGNASEQNDWLIALNNETSPPPFPQSFDERIVTFSGFLGSGPAITLEGALDADSLLALLVPGIFANHAGAVAPGVFLERTSLNRFDIPLTTTPLPIDFLNNDALIPLQSARFDGHPVARRVTCADYDHRMMKEDRLFIGHAFDSCCSDDDCLVKTAIFDSICRNLGCASMNSFFSDGFESDTSAEWGQPAAAIADPERSPSASGTWTWGGGTVEGVTTKKLSLLSPFPGCGANCAIETDVSILTVNGTAVLWGWYQNNQNFVELMMLEGTDKWKLKQHANGQIVAKGKSLQRIDPNVTYHVKFTYTGDRFLVDVNDIRIMEALTSTPASGTAGLAVKAKKKANTIVDYGELLTFEVQAKNCTFSLSSSNASFSAPGGAASVGVTTQPGCAWTAENNAPWIAVTAGVGSGSGTVNYSVDSNPDGAPRGSVMEINGQLLTISQSP